jgi:hypothetical protein
LIFRDWNKLREWKKFDFFACWMSGRVFLESNQPFRFGEREKVGGTPPDKWFKLTNRLLVDDPFARPECRPISTSLMGSVEHAMF